MSGSWGYSATCAFNTKVTGTVTYSRSGPGSYSARLIDSLGRVGRGSIRVSGRTVSGSNNWPAGSDSFTANLSSSGTSFSGRASSGCRFFVRR